MNRTIERIKAIDATIQALDKEFASGNPHAAGITIEMTTGAKNDDSRPPIIMEFGVYSDLTTILGAMRQGLVDSRAQWIKNAQREREELNAFLNPIL